MAFKEYMVLIFINFNLSVFPFMYHAFDVISKKALPDPRSQRFSPLFSPRSYIILGFMFSSIIYFKLSFYMMYSMNWSSLFFFAQGHSIVPFVEKNYLSTEFPLQHCQKSVILLSKDLILDPLSCSLDLVD